MNNLFRWAAPALALSIPLAALTQSATGDTVQTASSAPRLQYRSAFADYKPYKDVSPANWRAVNDAVAGVGGGAGGHAGHSTSGMPGMGQKPMADLPPKPASTKPAHEHHQMPGGKK
jgi:hypothetical protein